MNKQYIYLVGTCDTKYEELSYVKNIIEMYYKNVLLVDVGIKKHHKQVNINNVFISSYHPIDKDFLNKNLDRGLSITLMGEAFEKYITAQNNICGVIGLGGSGGTSIVTKGMRALPIGIPKLMVSTVASGNVSYYVGPNDIFMLNSVTDIAGINKISRVVLGNAANAIVGMVKFNIPDADINKPAIGITMFGVTTPCVDIVRKKLRDKFDCIVFHATGTGGKSMEKLLESNMLIGAIDITTTEICDLFMGGIMSAGEDRLDAIISTKKPYVGSIGALDMVNFGPIETVPEKYKSRNLYIHNPQITLMRTTKEENIKMGQWIANKLNKCEGEVRFLIPERGISMLDCEGQPFYDPEADSALFNAISSNFIETDKRKLLKYPFHINDKEFADALCSCFIEIILNKRG